MNEEPEELAVPDLNGGDSSNPETSSEESNNGILEGDQACPEVATDTILPVRRSTRNIQPPGFSSVGIDDEQVPSS